MHYFISGAGALRCPGRCEPEPAGRCGGENGRDGQNGSSESKDGSGKNGRNDHNGNGERRDGSGKNGRNDHNGNSDRLTTVTQSQSGSRLHLFQPPQADDQMSDSDRQSQLPASHPNILTKIW